MVHFLEVIKDETKLLNKVGEKEEGSMGTGVRAREGEYRTPKVTASDALFCVFCVFRKKHFSFFE